MFDMRFVLESDQLQEPLEDLKLHQLMRQINKLFHVFL